MFIKIDLRQGYNNVKTKEGDKQKAAFSMPEDAFEPTVMFFGVTNSPATFQAIMNNLLRDIIKVGDMIVFIDDIIIGTEINEGHDDIIEEVLRRMMENDLFVKPKKYVWKVREVGFLGVMIGLDRVKIEKEKVQRVVNQPVPRSVKNVQKLLGLAKYYRQFVKDFARVANPLMR